MFHVSTKHIKFILTCKLLELFNMFLNTCFHFVIIFLYHHQVECYNESITKDYKITAKLVLIKNT